MPQTVSYHVAAASQSPNPGVFIELFEVDLTRISGASEPLVLRFTPSAANPTAGAEGALSSEMEAPRWRGNVYLPVPVKCEGFSVVGDGPQPEPKITVPALADLFTPYLMLYDNMVGADVRRWRTYTHFLDNGYAPSPTEHYPVELYTIDRIGQRSKMFIEFILGTPMDQEGRMLPGRQILQRTCRHTYRRWNSQTGQFDYSNATCPYSGGAMFDAFGNATGDPRADKCSKDLALGCRIRPHPNGELPFWGFPGVARVRL